jgi:hypothetical protein
MEVNASVFGAGTSIWDAQRVQSLQPMQAKNFAAAIDAMGALSAEVKLYSGYTHCCAVIHVCADVDSRSCCA